MSNRKINLGCIFMTSLFIFVWSCEYDAVLPELPPTDEISFQQHIIPIFNEGCNSSGCHSGIDDFPPDLSPGRAYDALFAGNYIDTLTPESSLLYQWMLGNEGAAMPPTGTDPVYNGTILKWIEEGARNN